jgi:SAM-dependent methyltransferase
MPSTIYSDSTYLSQNRTWHEEDSPYKVGLIGKIVARNDIAFASLADVGCGAGLVAELLAKKYPGAQVHGYDVSDDASGFWAKRSAPNLQYFHTDYARAGKQYDLATCLDVFEHVEDYYGFIRNVSRNSTHIIFNIPLDMCVIKLITPGIRRARESVGHLHYFNRYTAVETVQDCGLEIVDSFLANPFFSTPPRNALQAILALPRMALALVSKRLCATLLGGHSLVVLAKVR